MSEYHDSNFNSEQSNFYNHEINGGFQPNPAPAPQHNPKKSSGKSARMAKKIGAIALSGVLFGSVAGATMVSFQYMANATATKTVAAQNPAAAAKAPETGLTRTTAISGTQATGNLDVTGIAQSVMPSIVSITNKSVQEVQNYFSMFGFGGQVQQQEVESCGSGIVIGQNDTELLIVTNYHVIENANTLSATFIDNQTYEAKMKGTDPANDLAVIAIPLSSISADTMSKLAVASIGNSDELQVGEQVVAIGNALGYGQSVTTGIVSAKERTLNTPNQNTDTQSNDSPTYIQTDAAINPGNSGGALVNMNGEVVGINSAKLASTEVEGMGYAIPISRVSNIIETLMNETTRSKVIEAERSSIGISGITVDENVNRAYGIPQGAFVAEVTKGGAADAAGIKKGEVITKFDGKAVADIDGLKELLSYYSAGETVEVTLLSPGSEGYTERTVTVTLGHAAAAQDAAPDASGNTENSTDNNAANNNGGFPFPRFHNNQ